MEIWTLAHQPRLIAHGKTFRIITEKEALIHWSFDGWATVNDLVTRVMRDSVAGSEICHQTSSRLATASSSHSYGKKVGKGKIFKWKLQSQITLTRRNKQYKQAARMRKQKDLSSGGRRLAKVLRGGKVRQ